VDNAVLVGSVVIVIGCVFFRVVNSEYGLAIKAFGCGRAVSESFGIDNDSVRSVALGIGNALSAIAGALMVQVLGTFSAYMGYGSLVFGIAALIIGEKFVEFSSPKKAVWGCFIGSVMYKCCIELFTCSSREVADYVGVVTAVVLIFLFANVNDQARKNRLENF
jgi:putative ABC transport system permease protein